MTQATTTAFGGVTRFDGAKGTEFLPDFRKLTEN